MAFTDPTCHRLVVLVWSRGFFQQRFARAALLILMLSVGGCSLSKQTFEPELVASLSLEGMTVLSPDNPFVAANLLVTRLAQKSPEVKGFIDHEGVPLAVETVLKPSEPLEIRFFYDNPARLYSVSESGAVWIIQGPAPISSEQLSILKQRGAALAALGGEQRTSPQMPPPEVPVQSEEPPRKVAASPLTEPSTSRTPAIEQQPPSLSTETQKLKLLAEAHGGALAEITPRGDLVHYVTFPGETLRMIARWYTFEAENAARLARINKRSNPDQVAIGDTIVIPSYMLQNRSRLTEAALNELQILARDQLPRPPP